MTETIIETNALTKTYFTRSISTTAVNEISVAIRRGEYVAVTGPSGSGKSTLLGLLSLIEQPTSGSIRFLGEELVTASPKVLAKYRAKNVGIVFQAFHLIPELTAVENVMLRMKYAARLPKTEALERARQVLEQVGLNSRTQHFPDQLSGGQQQRVAIARALVAEPDLLLADEPTGNLDTASGQQVLNIFDEANARGVTVVLVTHDAIAAARAQRVIKMRDGKIEEDRQRR